MHHDLDLLCISALISVIYTTPWIKYNKDSEAETAAISVTALLVDLISQLEEQSLNELMLDKNLYLGNKTTFQSLNSLGLFNLNIKA